MNVHLLYWAYCVHVGDQTRSDWLLQRLCGDMTAFYASSPDSFASWLDDVYMIPHDRLDYLQAFYRSIQSRNMVSKQCGILLTVFMLMSTKTTFRNDINDLWGTRCGPVIWFVKVAQRKLCMFANEVDEVSLLSLAIDCIGCVFSVSFVSVCRNVHIHTCPFGSQWCMMQHSSILEAVDSALGIPLLSFVGRLVLQDAGRHSDGKCCVICSSKSCTFFGPSDPSHVTATLGTVIGMMIECLTAARAEKLLYAFVTDNVRRTWIVTLQKLRMTNQSPRKKEAIRLWMALGKAYGFDERREAMWLLQGRNSESSRPPNALPWTHCGWSGCLCYEQRALFRLTACKGCYRVYYCGESCQKRCVR